MRCDFAPENGRQGAPVLVFEGGDFSATKLQPEGTPTASHIEFPSEVARMKRLSFLPLALLFVSTAFAQTNPADSDTLKALLTEVRQLRQDLRTTTVAAQRAQILVYRTQAQESVVRRLQERVDDARSKLAQIQSELKRLTQAVKQDEDLLDHTD